MTFDENAKLLTGGDIPAAVALLEGLGVDGIGFNCGLGPTQMKAFMKELTACCSTPIIVNPNAGLPKNVNGQTVYDVNPEEFAKRDARYCNGRRLDYRRLLRNHPCTSCGNHQSM